MPTAKIIIWPKINKDNTQTIMLRVSFFQLKRYYTLNIYVGDGVFNKDTRRLRKSFPGYKSVNARLDMIEQRAADALRRFEIDNEQFTFDKFEQRVFASVVKNGGMLNVYTYICDHVAFLKKSERLSSAHNYKHTANTVKRFKAGATLSDISPNWLKAFESNMRTHGMTDGGISLVMRNLRSICNIAIDQELLPRTWYPFAWYSLKHIGKKKAKRALSIEQIRDIEFADIPDANISFARDMFMLSFYTRGMNLADLALLKKSDIKIGRVDYQRKKTGRQYSVDISGKAGDIFAKYADTPGVFALPIMGTNEQGSAKSVYNRIIKVRRRINLSLKKIAEICGINDTIVFYTARHSFATGLKNKGVSIEVISESLGHSTVLTTDAYLKSFEKSVIDNASKLLEGP